MYLHIKDVLVNDSKIAVKLDKPVWVDQFGKVLPDETGSFGCKTDINITRPDLAIMFDKVGSNLSQEGDSVNGGEKYMCGPKGVLYQSTSTKSTHFTTLGVTRLDGQPLMSVAIISGKKHDLATKTGIDWNKLCGLSDDEIDNADAQLFLVSNYGSGKLFPGGPVCHYNGIAVPA